MTRQPEALRLADELCRSWRPTARQAAATLRGLHDTLGRANALLRIRADRIKELEAEVEALRADAERLDWCISVLYGGNWLTTDVGCGCCGESREFAADITGRAAIDVARGEK